MRFFILFFSLLLVFQPSFAQIKFPAELTHALQRQVAQKAERQLRQQTERLDKQKNALEKLAARQNLENWKEISWQEFLKQNEHTKGVEKVSTNLDIRCTENLFCLYPQSACTKIFENSGNSEVDYKKVLAGHKLIFVAEGMNHDTQRAPQEMAKILQAVREINPEAKILFAAEFLRWTDYNMNLPALKQALAQMKEINELIQNYQQVLFGLDYLSNSNKSAKQKQHRQNKQAYASALQQLKEWKQTVENNKKEADLQRESLLKKAGAASNLSFYENYASVFKAADKYGIDQLALDDSILGLDEDNQVAAKVGEFVVWATPQDKIPFWDQIKQSKEATEIKRFYALNEIVSVSPWGVRERNREWARRIKAVMPLYDIVLVYAGNGHLDSTYSLNLQPMLEQKEFMDILLLPLEKLPAQVEEYYQQRTHIAENYNITQDSQIQELYKDLENSQLKDFQQMQWKNTAKPFWTWGPPGLDQQMNDLCPPEQKRLLQAELEKQKQNFPFGSPTSFLYVYLPDK